MERTDRIQRRCIELVVLIALIEAVILVMAPRFAPEMSGAQIGFVNSVVLTLVLVPFAFWRFRGLVRESTAKGPVGAGARRPRLILLLILCLGLPLSGWVGWLLYHSSMERAGAQFDATALQAKRVFEDRAQRPVYLLNGVRSVYVASGVVRPDEFVRFAASYDLGSEFPGVRAIGLIDRAVDADEVAAEQWGGWVVRVAEPALSSEGLVGSEFPPNGVLDEAIRASIESGHPMISRPVELAGGNGPELVWVTPVYRDGSHDVPGGIADTMIGVAFAPLDMEALRAALEETLSEVASLSVMRVSDNGAVLMDVGTEASGSGGLICSEMPVQIGGQDWLLSFASTPTFEDGIDRVTPLLVGLCGSAIAVLLAGIVAFQASAGERARELADEMTYRVRLLSLVAEYTSNAVVVTDAEHRIEWVNAAFTRFWGYTLEEAFGQDPMELLHSNVVGDIDQGESVREALKNDEGYRCELQCEGKDGKVSWLDVDIQPVRDDAGVIMHYIAVETDLTRFKETEAELVEAKREAECANDAKSRFLGSLSHEIRTPLNGIIGFADLLRRGADEGDHELRDEWVGVIHGSGEHLLALLNDVLDLSKLDASDAEIHLRPASPSKVISNAVMLLRSRAVEKGVFLKTVIDERVPEAVRTDATRVRQIVMNLVANAVKFTRQGEVEVRATLAPAREPGGDDRLVIAVRDTGVGMTPEQMERIFTPFQQADRTVREEFGGTGLGLAISRELARRLGGDITVTSQKGIGSVFTVDIPALPLLEGESLPSDVPDRDSWDNGSAASAKPLEGVRILVADDVEANRSVASLFLKRAGAVVETAENGRQAVRLCEHGVYDLVLMDVQMPEMSGLEATERIREMGGRMPILALTAFSAGSDRGECLEAGMDDFLSKPFESSVLIQTAARWAHAGGKEGDDGMNIEEQYDPELAMVATDWLRSLGPRLQEAGAAVARGELEGVARLGHAIKGSGGSLGMPKFTEPGSRLEQAALDGDGSKAAAMLEEIGHLCGTTLERLQNHAA